MGKWTKYLRKYCIEWENDPELKDWLRPVPGDVTRAFCRFCKAILRAHHSDLLVHTHTRKHVRNTSIFLTSCRFRDATEATDEVADDNSDTHLCGRCGTRFKSLSTFIHHKVEEGYRLFYSPSERNQTLILPHLLEERSGTVDNNNSLFSGNASEVPSSNVTSVSMTIASLPEQYSDNENDIEINNKNVDDDCQETTEFTEPEDTTNSSNEGEKIREFFACCFCEKLFESLKSAQTHLKTSHHVLINGDEESNECLVTNTRIEQDLECAHCDKKFKEYSALRSHLLIHTSNERFTCIYSGCKFSTKDKDTLEIHTKTHSDTQPYVCRTCGRVFAENNELSQHESLCRIVTYETSSSGPTEDTEKLQLSLTDSTNSDNSNNQTEESGININKVSSNSKDVTSNSEMPSMIYLPLPMKEKEIENLSDDTLKEYKCSACSKSFSSIAQLRYHLYIHLSNDSLNCIVCSYAANDETDLFEHFNITAHQVDPRLYSEGLELQSSNFDKDLDLVSLNTNKTDIMEMAEKQLAELNVLPMNSNSKANISCPICLKLFKSTMYLKLHMKMHANPKGFQCPKCKRNFQYKDSLNKHMLSHTQSQNFMCSLCGKMYKRISHAREHMRVHTSERPYACNLCEKGFKSRNGLKVHSRTHSDEMAFSCEYCPCRFREKAALVRHRRTHTGEKPFSCKHCGRCFAEHGTLNRHLRAKVPCTMQGKSRGKLRKDDSEAIRSILYDNDKQDHMQEVNEMNVYSAVETAPDSFTDLGTPDEQQQYIITMDDQELLNTAQIQNASSLIIISQSDGTSETVVGEIPIETVMVVPEAEAEPEEIIT
ncbi:transcription factor E4F1-like [Centruroides sculpturatus]|uniref:transcription factor E4F1-like n=1 Tax=Centruroides sculpturatus TaxID=218467 RepID=UPI000C6C8BD8|nr:transcription factor E4F1-like [Centruroides sculpturatus]XP_023232204.1 transcription factor E4F1-like [Centruroides sculpturatus]